MRGLAGLEVPGGPRPRRRRLTWRVNEDGTITISATLPPEDGAVVLKALRASVNDHETEDLPDALAGVCAADDVSAETPPPRLPVTHPAHEDRCHLEDGPALSPQVLQYNAVRRQQHAMADAD